MPGELHEKVAGRSTGLRNDWNVISIKRVKWFYLHR